MSDRHDGCPRPAGRTTRLAAVIALGLGLLAPLPAHAAESVTYLFPAPPILPAFGPIQLAKGKGYFTEAGLDVNFQVARGGVEVAKQVGAGNAPIGGIVARRPDHGARQRRAGEDRRGVRRQGLHADGGARGFRHREAGRSEGQDAHRDVVPGHHVLCAARAARERRPDAERREHPGGRPDRRVGIRSPPANRSAWPACRTGSRRCRRPASR